MKNISVVIGTRPEAIKMAPVILELNKKTNQFKTSICFTGQHESMFSDAFSSFGLKPDVTLNVMSPNQSLVQLTNKLIDSTDKYYSDFEPDIVLVHGDTNTAMASSLAAFYQKIPIGHVEAGLRTYNKFSPFPEEFNRRLIALNADYHYAPTMMARNNLIKEGINKKNIILTGNTVIDSLTIIRDSILSDKNKFLSLKERFFNLIGFDVTKEKYILITAHRRENYCGIKDICISIKKLALNNPKVRFIFPVHLNPKIKDVVHKGLSDLNNVFLILPLAYKEFIFLMIFTNFILTDSGGIQEEAPAFGKKVLVMRDSSERPEAIQAGTAKLVSTKPKLIVKESQALLEAAIDNDLLIKKNPYGDGKAALKIINHLGTL
tara:strand:- start:11025 stop:12155 length:1131 start_codon:yes stop_codon:yes gene_type:complete